MTKHQIDATGMKLGRLATKVATLLMGKDVPSFRKNAIPKNVVEIENINKIDFTEKKLQEMTHTTYSGYPGGKKQASGKKIVESKGYKSLLTHAVSRMLPKNKNRELMIRNLIIKE